MTAFTDNIGSFTDNIGSLLKIASGLIAEAEILPAVYTSTSSIYAAVTITSSRSTAALTRYGSIENTGSDLTVNKAGATVYDDGHKWLVEEDDLTDTWTGSNYVKPYIIFTFSR